MRKLVISLLLSFSMLSLDSFAQKSKSIDALKSEIKTFSNSGRYDVNYDRFKDRTLVRRSMIAAKARIWNGWFVFGGPELKANVEEFYVSIYCSNKRPTIGNIDAIFIADNKRFVLTSASVSSDLSVSRYSSSWTELFVFELTRQNMKAIAASGKVEFQICGTERTLDGDDLENFKNLFSLGTIDSKADDAKVPDHNSQ